jgi:hypothetical protein
VLLNRSRTDHAPQFIEANGGDKSLTLTFDRAWLDDNPLTLADLERETNYLKKTGYDLLID